MKRLKEFLNTPLLYSKNFIKWTLLGVLTGILGGVIGAVFHLLLDYATEFRTHHNFLIYFLPVAGLVIAGIYYIFRKKGNLNTNRVIKASVDGSDVPAAIVPLIFVGTILTHLFGGSAGREGAALQLGGGIGNKLAKILKLDADKKILTSTGMSSVFSALFGTPVAAAIFPLEIAGAGILNVSTAFVCIIASVTARFISSLFGISPIAFDLNGSTLLSATMLIKTAVLALLCVGVGFLFCKSIKLSERYASRFVKNPFLRAFLGGAIVVLLTILVGSYDYNGAGMDVITNAISGNARPEAFILKIIFTAITLAAGFRGGEIVPAFFVGSTFGCVIAPILGLDPGFGAALGMVSLFCSVTKSPIASIFLAVEIFGAKGIVFFALACAVTYVMSGYNGLYKAFKPTE